MATKSGGDEVVLPQIGANAHGSCFLTLALVDRARHDAFEEEELDTFLELPDRHHALVQTEQEVTFVIAFSKHHKASPPPDVS